MIRHYGNLRFAERAMEHQGHHEIPPVQPLEKIALYALLISITAVSIDIVLPAYQAIAAEFSLVAVTDLQNNILVFICGMFFGELVAGFYADIHGRKKIMLISVLIYLAGTVTCLIAADFAWLLLGRLLQGIGAAGQKICTRAIIRDTFSGGAMARVMSFVMMTFIVLPFVAPYMGTFILEQFGWRRIFVFLAVFALVSLSWFWQRQPETLPAVPPSSAGPASAFHLLRCFITHPRTAGYTLTAGILFGVHLAFLSLAPLVFWDLYGISEDFPFYFGCLSAAFGVALFLNAQVVTRLGMARVVDSALLLLLITAAFIALCTTLYARQPPFVFFFCYLFATLLSLGLIFGNLNALIMEPLGGAAGLGNAFASACSTLVALPVSYMAGVVYQQTLASFVLPLGLSCVVATGACLYARRGQMKPLII